MRFSDIPGHSAVKSQLRSMFFKNRLSHALLFTGREGSGILPLATAFAQYLVCEKVNRQLNGETESAGPSLFGDGLAVEHVLQEPIEDSCGVCPACVKSHAVAHPDIHFTFPVIPLKAGSPPVSADYFKEWREFLTSNPYGNIYDWLSSLEAENKQGNITARECEEILQQLNLKSFESGYKILILWGPEYLGKEGNKLLKMIEEPPADTLFILVAEDESQILPTIVSRTQMVRVPLFDNRDISEFLVARHKAAPEKANAIAVLAEGNIHEAIHAVQEASEDWLKHAREWMNAIIKNGPVAQVKLCDELNKLGREKQKQFFAYMIHLIEQSMRSSTIQQRRDHLPERELEFTDRFAGLTGFYQQEAMVKELEKAIYYIERNASFKLLFMALTIKFYQIIKYNSLILIN